MGTLLSRLRHGIRMLTRPRICGDRRAHPGPRARHQYGHLQRGECRDTAAAGVSAAGPADLPLGREYETAGPQQFSSQWRSSRQRWRPVGAPPSARQYRRLPQVRGIRRPGPLRFCPGQSHRPRHAAADRGRSRHVELFFGAGRPPAQGRWFMPEEDRPGAEARGDVSHDSGSAAWAERPTPSIAP